MWYLIVSTPDLAFFFTYFIRWLNFYTETGCFEFLGGLTQIINQLTVMCKNSVERGLISIWCQKKCVESKLVIFCRMMRRLDQSIPCCSRIMSIFHLLTTDGRTRALFRFYDELAFQMSESLQALFY